MAVSALSVTVTVSDVDEDGKVSLSTKLPRKGVAVTATPGPPTASEPAAGWSLPEKGRSFTCPTVRGVSRGLCSAIPTASFRARRRGGS